MIRKSLIALLTLAALGTGAPARAASVDHAVLMSNFRFCPTRPFPCDPLDIGYVASPGGNAPAIAQYSPITTVSVKPGDTVTWTYDEPLCAQHVFCPPHTATFVDGSFASADANTQGTKIVFTVPLTAKAGTVYAYYCRYHAPAGMNGAIQVS